VISGMPPNRVAAATGLSFTLRTLAGSFATSLTTTWWDRREALHQAHLTERLTAFEPVARAALDQLHALGMRGDAAFAVIQRTLVQQAYMLGTNDMFWLWGWILLALIGLTWLTRPPFLAGRTAQAGE
jgi:DHA2 family multidrug resistance protein